MVKTFNIIRKVDDPRAFEKFFIENMLPLIFRTKSPQVKVTKVVQLTTDREETIEGIQYIIEAYYDSLEAIDQTVQSEKGQDVMQESNAMPGELSIFIANEKFIPASPRWNKPVKRD